MVIEDIDSAGIGREQGPSSNLNAATQNLPDNHPGLFHNVPPPPPARGERRRNMVTLSGLLNAIDGNASQEGW